MATQIAVIEAHRGASAERPENSMSAFRRAIELGVPSIELDIHESRDGELIVMHDATVERTTRDPAARAPAGQAPRAIADLTLAELRRLDCGLWKASAFRGERIPTLEEVLALVAPRNVRLNVEVKAFAAGSGAPGRLVELLRRYAPKGGRHVVSSFDAKALLSVREADQAVPLAILGNAPEILPVAREQSFPWIHAAHGTLSVPLVAEAHKEGILVMAWTVNRRGLYAYYAGMGIDKLCTDMPGEMIAAQRELAALLG